MACRRAAGTIGAGILEVIQSLSPIDIEEATGKTANHFYKCSNPNNSIGLHLKDAIALDGKLREVGKSAIFYPHYQSCMHEVPNTHITQEEHMLALVKEVGEVAQAMGPNTCLDTLGKELNDVVLAALKFRNCAAENG